MQLSSTFLYSPAADGAAGGRGAEEEAQEAEEEAAPDEAGPNEPQLRGLESVLAHPDEGDDESCRGVKGSEEGVRWSHMFDIQYAPFHFIILIAGPKGCGVCSRQLSGDMEINYGKRKKCIYIYE